jgi:Flp pilus assembly protein TadB
MDDLAVLAIPAVLVAGLVLVGLGADGRAKASGSRRWTGRFQDWATQAGVRGVRLWQVVAVCGGAGVAVGMAVLVLTRSLWLGLAFAGLAGWLPLGALRARRRRRLRELGEVWPDAIDNLASGVRAERGPETLRAPFARFADDYHANGRFGTALDRLKDELADPTADRVVEALRLAREVGGSELGRTLRTLSGFLRDEQRVRKELEARQTWVVVAARMAFATPWAVLLLLATKPEAVAAYRGTGGDVARFRAEQVLWGLTGFVAAVLLTFVLPLVAGRSVSAVAVVGGAVLGVVGGVLGRDGWPGRQVARRQGRILRELPTLADLLCLAVTAGEGPRAALERTVARSHGELSRELALVLADLRAGEPFTTAMERLAVRVPVPAVTRFVDGVVVAVERGTPLGDVLRAQAADVREQHKRDLIEAGGRREVLMLVPVVFLELPVVILFALYPGLVSLSQLAR